jgi:hypothetical protein
MSDTVEVKIPVEREAAAALRDERKQTALAAGVETIVSSDEDLLVLHPWRGIRILSPATFLARASEVTE